MKITNGNIITPYRVIDECSIWVKDGKIADIQQGGLDVPDDEIIDAGGCYISPGFIDLHVHGGGGHDFMDNTVEAYLTIAQTHARYGTTGMYPTTLTAEKADLLKTLTVYEQA